MMKGDNTIKNNAITWSSCNFNIQIMILAT